MRPPAGARVDSLRDERHYVAGLDAASGAIGVELSESTLLPDGFRPMVWLTLEERNVWASWLEPKAWGPATGDDTADNAAQTLYTRGLAAFAVEIVPTSRVTELGGFEWSELLAYEPVALQYGSFSGRTAHTYFDDAPTAIVWNDEFAVRVAGCVTRTDIVAVLEGLELSPP
jgi:hypothetical protein